MHSSERSTRSSLRFTTIAAALLFWTALIAHSESVPNRTIGFALTDRYWAIYQTADGKSECPDGFNDGEREQFGQLFPNDGKQRKLVETQLAYEADVWYPAENDPTGVRPFKEAKGKIAPGLNLDGKVGPNDFTSPENERGIDNQLFRVLGCITGFRGPEGAAYFFDNDDARKYAFNRLLVEITDVDDLVNDDDVTVSLYRGVDPLITDATGNQFIVGSTQHVDDRWGKTYIQHLKGKIIDGVLTTEPGEITIPYSMDGAPNPDQTFKAGRLRLKLTSTSAQGLLAGYVDIKDWHHRFALTWSTHHSNYGQMALPSMVRAMRRLADAYPDAATGKNSAISAALDMKLVQTFIVHDHDGQGPRVSETAPVRSAGAGRN